MKKIIVLLLFFLADSSLFAQENTVLGTGALAQGGHLNTQLSKLISTTSAIIASQH